MIRRQDLRPLVKGLVHSYTDRLFIMDWPFLKRQTAVYTDFPSMVDVHLSGVIRGLLPARMDEGQPPEGSRLRLKRPWFKVTSTPFFCKESSFIVKDSYSASESY